MAAPRKSAVEAESWSRLTCWNSSSTNTNCKSWLTMLVYGRTSTARPWTNIVGVTSLSLALRKVAIVEHGNSMWACVLQLQNTITMHSWNSFKGAFGAQGFTHREFFGDLTRELIGNRWDGVIPSHRTLMSMPLADIGSAPRCQVSVNLVSTQSWCKSKEGVELNYTFFWQF